MKLLISRMDIVISNQHFKEFIFSNTGIKFVPRNVPVLKNVSSSSIFDIVDRNGNEDTIVIMNNISAGNGSPYMIMDYHSTEVMKDYSSLGEFLFDSELEKNKVYWSIK